MNQKWFVNVWLAVGIIIVIGVVAYLATSRQGTPFIDTLPRIQFDDLSNFSTTGLGCISDVENEFVINNDSGYKNLIQYKSTSPQCNNFVLPQINLSQNTLLGKYSSGSGCSVDFSRKIYRDDSSKKVSYTVDVLDKGACEMLGSSMNWALVPKIPSDYTVEFQVK